MNRPDRCPTCFESLDNEEKPLDCGHWIHIECIQKGHRPMCHLCRRPLNIEVFGKLDLDIIVPEYAVVEVESDDDSIEDESDRDSDSREIDYP